MSDNTTQFRVTILSLAILAFAARLAYVLSTPGFTPQHDAHHYDLDALYIANVHHYPPIHAPNGQTGPNAFRPPVYAFLLAAVYKANLALSVLGLSRWEAARLTQAVLGAVAVAALALIARRLWDRRMAVVAGLLTALFPPMIFVAGSMYSESVFVPLVTFATAAIVEYRHLPRRSMLMVAALLTGLAALTRDYGALLLIPFCVAIRPRGGFSWRGLRPAAALAAGTALVVAPWTIRNALVLHAFVPVSTSGGNTLAGTYNDVSRTAKRYPAAWREPSRIRAFRRIYEHDALKQARENSQLESAVARYVGIHPTYPFVVAYWNTIRLLELEGRKRSQATAHLIGVPFGDTDVGVDVLWVMLALAVGGCVTPRIRAGEKWIWLVPAVMYVGVIFVQSETPRFRSPIDPFITLLSSAAVVEIWERFARCPSRLRAAVASDQARP